MLRSLATGTKLLYKDVTKFSVSPRIVDLSATDVNSGSNKKLEDGSVVAVGGAEEDVRASGVGEES